MKKLFVDTSAWMAIVDAGDVSRVDAWKAWSLLVLAEWFKQ